MKRIILCALFATAFTACHTTDPGYDAAGTFEAVETIVPAQANGVLTDYRVQEGQQLKAGEVVGHIDTIQLYLEKLQLQSEAGAILSKTPDAAAQLAALHVQLDRDSKELTRITHLYDASAATGQQLDAYTARVKVDEKRLAAMESTLHGTTHSLKKQTGSVIFRIASVEDQLAKCRIVNPVSGTVLTNYTEPHEMATVGRPLYKIADLSTVNLRAYMTADEFDSLRLNQPVTVRADDGKRGFRRYPGIVAWISDKAEFTPKTIQTRDERTQLVYALKIRVKNDGYLKIGMYGEVSFKPFTP